MSAVYDVIFLGGGPAGYQGAIRAAQLGGRVAVVESAQLGGVCLNKGCIPTKTIKASVEVLRLARKAKTFGINVEGITPDIAAIIARKNKVVELLRGGIRYLFKQNRIDLLEGVGRLNSPGIVEVNQNDTLIRLQARKIVIATGSRPARPVIAAGDTTGVLTTDDILEISSVPPSLLVLGGGAVGVEMAAIMAELGSMVTLIEMEKTILPREDAQMVEYLQTMLKRRKVKILTGVKVLNIEGDSGVRVTLDNGKTLENDKMLLAVGRVAKC